jgi:hypothetical protein
VDRVVGVLGVGAPHLTGVERDGEQWFGTLLAVGARVREDVGPVDVQDVASPSPDVPRTARVPLGVAVPDADPIARGEPWIVALSVERRRALEGVSDLVGERRVPVFGNQVGRLGEVTGPPDFGRDLGLREVAVLREVPPGSPAIARSSSTRGTRSGPSARSRDGSRRWCRCPAI